MNTNTATRFVNKSILYLKKYSPQILTGIGVGGFATTVVLAAKETLEVQPILDDHKVFIAHHEEMYVKGEINKKELGKNNLSVWSGCPHSDLFLGFSQDHESAQRSSRGCLQCT